MATMRSSGRTGRRPGRSDTRERILGVAAERFRTQGYAATSLRAVAREAGVDPALVVHFFGTKVGLFMAVLDWPFDPREEIEAIVAGGLDQLGPAVVRSFLSHWEVERLRSPIITLLNAATAEPASARMLREFLQDQLLEPLVGRAAADHAGLRAGLVASQLLGLGIARYVLALEPLASATEAEIVGLVGAAVQRYCTAPWDELEAIGPAPS